MFRFPCVLLRLLVLSLLLPLAGCATMGVQREVAELSTNGQHNRAVALFDANFPRQEDADKIVHKTYCQSLFAIRSYRKADECADRLLARMATGKKVASNAGASAASTVAGLLVPLPTEDLKREYLGAVFHMNQRRAEMHLALGDLDRALEYGRAQRELNWGGFAPPLTGALFVSGMVHAKRGERDAAVAAARELEQAKFKIGFVDISPDWFKRSAAWWAADIYLALGMVDEARRVVSEKVNGSLASQLLLANTDQLGGNVFWGFYEQIKTSQVAFRTGDFDTARDGYDGLLAMPLLDNWPEFKFLVLHERGQIALQDGEVDRAIELFRQAVELIESARSTIDSEASRIGFVGDKQDVYASLVSALVGEGRHREAFEYAERGKARALVDLLASRPPAASGSPTELERALTELRKAEEASALLDHDAVASRTASTRSVSIADAVSGFSPEVRSLVSVEAVSVREIQSHVAPGEAIVEYYHHGDVLLAFVVTRRAVRAIPLASDGLAEEIASLRSRIVRPMTNAYRRDAQQLHARLVAPLLPALRERHWIVVPDGPLHYLPFAALHDGEAHLIERVSLRVLPSASVMRFVRTRRSAPGGSVLALGNPALDDESLALPSAEVEARAITQGRRDARVLLRDAATETAVKQHGGSFRYLHFATHGEFDEGTPLASRLLLGKDAANDGSLTVSEIYDLELDADLVTLSACETGMGSVASGDDVVGLTRGFLYAGSRAIVASLWPVSDQATERLMREFYGELESANARDALRRAQLEVQQQGLRHPFYWAAFQLTGAAVGAPGAAATP